MAYNITIVCLANSRKNSGRCIAGKILEKNYYGQWIRPISSRPTKEISELERRYTNGDRCSVLDIVTIPIIKHSPTAFQKENCLIDENDNWVYKDKFDKNQIINLIDHVNGTLWLNETSSSHGINDRVEKNNNFSSSLYMIEVKDLVIRVMVENPKFNNKRKVRGAFTHNNVPYRLSITDPEIEQAVLSENDGEYTVGKAILCISLADEGFEGYHYKFIAKIFHDLR